MEIIKMFFFKKYNLAIITFCLLLLTFSINYLTPLHSDDFSYFLQGMDLNKKINHYMGWSGRIVADIISSCILLIDNKVIISIIQSSGLVTLIYLISQLPQIILKKENNVFNFIFIFILYWICNPNLGQIAFWIVGSANYMWVALIAVIYLLLLLTSFYNGKTSNFIYIIAPFAGCSNENISIILVIVTALLLLYQSLLEKRINKKLCIIFTLVTIGSMFLILSPGNTVRLTTSIAHTKWVSLSFTEKMNLHIFTRIPDALNLMEWTFYLLGSILTILISTYSNNKNELFFIKKKPTLFTMSVLFCIFSITSLIAMAFSPVVPSRSLSGPFLFILISISLSMSYIDRNIIFNKILKIILIPTSIIFLLSYISIFDAYKSTYLQEKIRLNLINDAINLNKNQITIPDFYFKSLLRHSYMFDRYIGTKAMSEYYQLIKIEVDKNIGFDYSVINNKNNKIFRNNNMRTKNGLLATYFYTENFTRDLTIIFEISLQEKNLIEKNDRMFLHVYNKSGKGKFNNFDIGKPIFTQIGNRLFIYKKLGRQSLKNISHVNFGIFNSENGNRDVTIKMAL